jgi:hypothetical protein
MKRRAVSLALLLVATIVESAQDSAPPAPRFPTARITADQLGAYTAEVQSISDIQCRDIWAHQRECSSDVQKTIWIFTLPGHPAHPAVSRGIMIIRQIDRGTTVGIDRVGHYAGDSAAFDKWMNEFRVVDQKQLAQWQSALQRK